MKNQEKNEIIKKHMIEYFDKAARQWNSIHSPRTKEIALKGIKRIEIKPGNKILDVGAGTGLLVPTIKSCEKIAYTGIEISSEMINHFKNNYPEEEILHQDFETECSLDKKFDIIILFDTLNLITNPTVLLRNSFNHLKEQGRFIAYQSRTRKEMLAWQEKQQYKGGKALLPDNKKIRELCDLSGFTVSEISDTEYFFMELLSVFGQ